MSYQLFEQDDKTNKSMKLKKLKAFLLFNFLTRLV